MNSYDKVFEGYYCPVRVTKKQNDIVYSVAAQLGKEPDFTDDYVVAFTSVVECILRGGVVPVKYDALNSIIPNLIRFDIIGDGRPLSEDAIKALLNQFNVYNGLDNLIKSEDSTYYTTAVNNDFVYRIAKEDLAVELGDNGLQFSDIQKVVSDLQSFLGLKEDVDREAIHNSVISNIMLFNSKNVESIMSFKFLTPQDETLEVGGMLSNIRLGFIKNQLMEEFHRHFAFNILIDLLTVATYSKKDE